MSATQLAWREWGLRMYIVIRGFRTIETLIYPRNKYHSSIYFSLNNGPILNGSITLKSNVGGIPS